MLAAKGFSLVYNLKGGIKAWDSQVAHGSEDEGLELFAGEESLERTLAVAYAMEQGLGEFYTSMATQSQSQEAAKLFTMLASIEEKHQQHIAQLYEQSTGQIASEALSRQEIEQVMEGGLTTEEYMARFQVDWQSVTEVAAVAMSIEAQALDLYQRAAERQTDQKSKEALSRIATEEQGHLKLLGDLIDGFTKP